MPCHIAFMRSMTSPASIDLVRPVRLDEQPTVLVDFGEGSSIVRSVRTTLTGRRARGCRHPVRADQRNLSPRSPLRQGGSHMSDNCREHVVRADSHTRGRQGSWPA